MYRTGCSGSSSTCRPPSSSRNTITRESALLTLQEGRAEKRSKVGIGAALTAVLVALEAELLLASGLGSEAAALLTPNRLRRAPRLAVPRSRSLLLAGDHAQAASLADRHALRESLPWHIRVELLLVSASASLRDGDRDTAQERFDRAASIAERTGPRTPFVSMPAADLQVLGASHPRLLAGLSSRSARYPEPSSIIALSRREQRVLIELAEEATLPEIARTLSISTNTLKSQLRSIYRKLGAAGRHDAVQIARRLGLVLLRSETTDEESPR